MTLQEVENRIGPKNLKAFSDWMYGQTCGLLNGGVNYYEHDVERFMDYHCNPDIEPNEAID